MSTADEVLYSLPDLNNVTDVHVPLSGWVSSSRDRGSIDILWSCISTIVLCCWVATHPNAGAPEDKWYHAFQDKTHLALIGVLGPDFLMGIAVGQLCSARRSVKRFAMDKTLTRGKKWTLQYGFFVDMGGLHLTSPDFPGGFPINAEQLHYLLKHGHVDFPDMDDMMISERNSADTLSRAITAWQVTWFSVTELQRVADGLPMSTLELTALSYVPIMLTTTMCWYWKPSIISPKKIHTKDEKTVAEIRIKARETTHPDLPGSPNDWYRTPLDFLSHYRWGIGTHWDHYIRLDQKLRLQLVSRPIKTRLWNRYPSDLWLPPDLVVLPFVAPAMIIFCISFLLAWNFFFPSPTEKFIWRAGSIYHAFFSSYGAVYYIYEAFRWNWKPTWPKLLRRWLGPRHTPPTSGRDTPHIAQDPTLGISDSGLEAQAEQPKSTIQRLKLWSAVHDYVTSFRNLSLDKDPQMNTSLRLTVPVAATCIMYILFRLYIYVEDFISFRVQPVGVYITVNRFLPFIGD